MRSVRNLVIQEAGPVAVPFVSEPHGFGSLYQESFDLPVKAYYGKFMTRSRALKRGAKRTNEVSSSLVEIGGLGRT